MKVGPSKVDPLADGLIATADDDRTEVETAGQLRVVKFTAKFK